MGIFELLIVFVYLTGGRTQSGSHTDWLALSITYPAGIAVAGAIFGAARPLFRFLWLAIPVACVALSAWFAGIAIASAQSLRDDWQGVVVLSMFFGSIVGGRIWWSERRASKGGAMPPGAADGQRPESEGGAFSEVRDA
jgi:hypothetical protein